MEYEQLGQAAVMRKLLRLLDLPEPAIEEALARTGGMAGNDELKFARGPSAAERIQNYDEIRDRLCSSRYRKWVEA